MNKTQAIKEARNRVTDIYRFGDGYKFNTYDPSVNAWRESPSKPYINTVMDRSCSMLAIANNLLEVNDNGFSAEYDYIQNGGNWTDYVG